MTSEAIAKLISESGVAATELTPFAASTAIGDASTLRTRIESLEQIPALAEFARAVITAMEKGGDPSGAESIGRSLENLQAAATAVLRHLHSSDALQSIGSQHAVWVQMETRVPLSRFAERVCSIQRGMEALTSLPQVGATVNLEAADTGSLALKVGIGNLLACELIASVLQYAKIIQTRRHNASASIDDIKTLVEHGARDIALAHLGSAFGKEEVRHIADSLDEFVKILGEGVYIYPTLQTPPSLRVRFPYTSP